MTAFLRIIIGLLVLAALILGGAMFLPDSAHVERSIEIAAPPEAVFAHVIDYRKWQAWSPWAGKDPNMKLIYQGPQTGVGAKMSWQSDKPAVGSGSQHTTEVVDNQLIRSRLGFGGRGEADTLFRFEPSDAGCYVTWGFDAELGANPIARVMGLLFDRMLGPEYEAGLSKLKALVEGGAS
jgi:uncharacterized protein YndB with AHSA1/START domain